MGPTGIGPGVTHAVRFLDSTMVYGETDTGYHIILGIPPPVSTR